MEELAYWVEDVTLEIECVGCCATLEGQKSYIPLVRLRSEFKLEAHDTAMLLEMTTPNAVLPFTAGPHVSFHKPNAGI